MSAGNTDYKNPVTTPDATVLSNSDRISSLKELMQTKFEDLKALMEETDHRYEDRFKAMDEKTGLALTSSEKAVTKAEMATEKRFDSVNEFRDTLRDQASMLMPRPETQTMFKAFEEKLGTMQSNFLKITEDQKRDISNLQLARSESGGKEKQGIFEHDNKQFNLSLVVSIIALILALSEIFVLMAKR